MYRIAEIEIGMPKGTRCCTAVIIQAYKDYLSENSESYWCSLDEYGMHLKIGKQSKPGLAITDAIQKSVATGQIEYLLLSYAIEQLTPRHLLNIIQAVRREAKEEGRTEIRNGMLNLLFPKGI